MTFDPVGFLNAYAAAYNARDPEAMRGFLALDDPRFAMFEDFSGELLNGATYNAMLESVADATGEMSFELLRSDLFGDQAVVHGYQHLRATGAEAAEEGIAEWTIRATVLVSVSGGAPRILAGHFSAIPEMEDECGCGCEDESEGGCCGGHHEGV
jgi:hypothetical protein